MKKISVYLLLFCLGILQASAQAGFQRTPMNALYRQFTHNTGAKIKVGDVITLNVVEKTDKDSIIFSSYSIGHPVPLQVQAPKTVVDLMEIFPLLTVNDSVLVRIPADSLVKGHEAQRPSFLPSGSYLNYTLKVVKVQSLDEAMAEQKALLEKMKQAETEDAAKYIAANKLAVKTTPSGLKYVVTRASLKRKPVTGDTLLVNYTGRFLNGKVFDSNIVADARAAGVYQPERPYEPLELVAGLGQVIPGWNEGLMLLNEGSKATFVIPSGLAYGDRGYGDIPPYSTLVFDVELVKIKPAKHTHAAPAAKKPAAHTTTTTKKSVRKS